MIRITKQSDYGIVLMTRFAADRARGIHTARDLASETYLPLPTVSKILKALARGGILQSHRGVKGGYSLAREPALISVAEVISALEGPIAITECLEEVSSDCGIETCCPVRTNWERINLAVRHALAGIPITEMIPAFPLAPRAAAATAEE